jgi:uncharacterized membrane protein
VTRGIGAIWGFFTGGNPLVRVGALVLFVGVAFLLKYISERVSVSIEMRLLGIAMGGLAMVVFGLLVRRRKPGFALPFQGAGIGVLYLTTYTAFRLYPVLPHSVALILMLAIVGLTIGLALWQDAAILASFGVVGGFLAPVLTSTGQGSHVELFSFYLVLNLVVGVVAWFRAWRWLNWLGFVFTFGIASMWGAEYYRPEHFASTEPFLLAHVFLYLAISVLFAMRQPPQLKGLVDATLVFGTPLVGFTLQALLLEGDENALAISSAAFGVIYLVLRQVLMMRDRAHFQLLGQCFLALGAGFLTLAIPLAFDARVTSAMWTLEGTAVAWVGIRQNALVRRWVGYALMLAGSFAYLAEDGGSRHDWAFLNADFIGVAIIALGFVFVADRIRHHDCDPRVPILASLFAVFGSLWWFLGGLLEMEEQLTGASLLLTTVGYFALAIGVTVEYARRQDWRVPRGIAITAALILPVMGLIWRMPETGPMLRSINTLANAGVLVVLCACGRWLIHSSWAQADRSWANVLAGVALATWLLSGITEIEHHLSGSQEISTSLIFASLSLMAGFAAASPVGWPEWRRCLEVLALVPGAFLLILIDRQLTPMTGLGLLAWPLALGGLYGLLHVSRSTSHAHLDRLHALAFWSLLGVATYAIQFEWQARFGNSSMWALASLSGIPALGVWLASLAALDHRWPVAKHTASYRGPWLWPLVLWIMAWTIASNAAMPGDYAPMTYLPVLNVQDLTSLFSLVIVSRWWLANADQQPAQWQRIGGSVLGAIAFFWLNTALLRALHVYLPIRWDFDLMLGSFTVQASITLLWVCTALGLMVTAARLSRRWIWMVGAALMGVVVVKLFLVDTAASGTLARIAAFFGVAIGLFVAGYFVPRPPAGDTEEAG